MLTAHSAVVAGGTAPGRQTANEEAAAIVIDAADQARIQSVVDKRVVAKTKAQYAAEIVKFVAWLSVRYPRFVEKGPDGANRLVLPLQKDVVLAYLSEMQHRPDTGQLKASSTMNSIGSAIADIYKDRNMQISTEIKQGISNFMAGHRRMVALAKENGELPIFEGKKHLTYTVSPMKLACSHLTH